MMRNIATWNLVAALALAAWPLCAPAQDTPETTFTAEKSRVVVHQPSTAPTDDAWKFNVQTAHKRQRDTADVLGSPVHLALPLGDKTVLKLAMIPAGAFDMGSPRNEKYRNADEARHRVTITKPFYMGIYPVTQEQWEQVMGKNLSQFHGPRRPVENVTYDEAVQFCYKASQRTGRKIALPTEAQWEYACRAGTDTPYNTGNRITSDQADFDGTQEIGQPMVFTKQHHKGDPQERKNVGIDRQCTTDVGRFQPNAFGLYDMHGNVYQWCADWYDEGYYILSPEKDPTGPPEGKLHVFRGGSWACPPWECASARRHKWEPDSRTGQFGLRVVCTDIEKP
jgi:formylglycine-generating enzyme required for sulfatase activity